MAVAGLRATHNAAKRFKIQFAQEKNAKPNQIKRRIFWFLRLRNSTPRCAGHVGGSAAFITHTHDWLR